MKEKDNLYMYISSAVIPNKHVRVFVKKYDELEGVSRLCNKDVHIITIFTISMFMTVHFGIMLI